MNSLLHAAEVPWVDPETTRHRFEVSIVHSLSLLLYSRHVQTVLEESSYTDEKFELFKKWAPSSMSTRPHS